ncbi:MAG: Asp-tRNA(Asn)/Glu-tRNA(Gln) amidotransferase subunit GatC [Candidatus Puniceispirillaceae bacterium]
MSADKAIVDSVTVEKIARLARIRLAEERKEPIAQDLNRILSWIEELNEVDTDGVEPLASVTGHSLPLRQDEITDGDIQDKIVSNAPEEASGFFVVPKVVE